MTINDFVLGCKIKIAALLYRELAEGPSRGKWKSALREFHLKDPL